MTWNLEEAITYYQKQGAPRDQTALVALMKEIQQELGMIPGAALTAAAQAYGVKESFLKAIIARIPSLRLDDTHLLRLCAGPNCGKHTQLAAHAEALVRASGGKVRLEFRPCMRMCGKGPNLQWDGTLHHKATVELLDALIRQIEKTP